MKPLNYAILQYMTTVPEACADDVLVALDSTYKGFRAFSAKAITDTLLTAEVNGLLEQTRFDLDDHGNLRLYFRANEDGKATIRKYIK